MPKYTDLFGEEIVKKNTKNLLSILVDNVPKYKEYKVVTIAKYLRIGARKLIKEYKQIPGSFFPNSFWGDSFLPIYVKNKFGEDTVVQLDYIYNDYEDSCHHAGIPCFVDALNQYTINIIQKDAIKDIIDKHYNICENA